MVIGKKKEEYACTILFISSLEKAWRPARIEPLQTEKKPSWSQGSNPACSDRMPLLYRLRHHRGHFVLVNVMFRISFAKKQQSSLTNSQSCNWFSQFPEMSTNFEILFQSLNFTKVSRASFHCDLTSSHFYRAQVQNNAKEVEKNFFQTYRKKVDGCKIFFSIKTFWHWRVPHYARLQHAELWAELKKKLPWGRGRVHASWPRGRGFRCHQELIFLSLSLGVVSLNRSLEKLQHYSFFHKKHAQPVVKRAFCAHNLQTKHFSQYVLFNAETGPMYWTTGQQYVLKRSIRSFSTVTIQLKGLLIAQVKAGYKLLNFGFLGLRFRSNFIFAKCFRLPGSPRLSINRRLESSGWKIFIAEWKFPRNRRLPEMATTTRVKSEFFLPFFVR